MRQTEAGSAVPAVAGAAREPDAGEHAPQQLIRTSCMAACSQRCCAGLGVMGRWAASVAPPAAGGWRWDDASRRGSYFGIGAA